MSATPLLFLLGTHQPHWLHSNTVPLFISDRRLRSYRRLPVAAGLPRGSSFPEPVASNKPGAVHADYLACVTRYADAGVDLTVEPLCGLGSVCRRQATGEAAEIVTELRQAGIENLHGFGVKTTGLLRYGHQLASADSLAWSFAARRSAPLPGCEGQHINCANCRPYAMAWRSNLLAQITTTPVQPDLWEGTA